jgi:hypothetical protein
MFWKALVVFVALALGITGYVFYEPIVNYLHEPDVVSKNTTTEVERLAAEQHLEVSPEADIVLMFSQRKGWGGAGGQGNSIVVKRGPAELVQEARKGDRNLTIHYALDYRTNSVTKSYAVLAPEAAYSWTAEFSPGNDYVYNSTASTNEMLVFDKEPGELMAGIIFLGLIALMFAALFAFITTI